MESSFYLPIFLIAGGIIFLIIFFHYVPFFLWLSAKVSGVHISLIQLFLMRIRNVPPYIIVPGMIEAHKAGLKNITRDELEAHYLAGGHVEKVVHALVSASKAILDSRYFMRDAVSSRSFLTDISFDFVTSAVILYLPYSSSRDSFRLASTAL